MILGGVVISSLGAGTMYFLEEVKPSVKTVARDFIIGAVMMLMIVQLLPESSEYMISTIMALIPVSLSVSALATPEVQQKGGEETGELEVKVGVPNF
jgi:hypothetical protein